MTAGGSEEKSATRIPAARAGRSAVWLVPLLLFAVLVAIPTRSPSGDAYEYGRMMRGTDAPPETNPNRLLLYPTVRYLYERVAIPLSGRSIEPLETLVWISRLSYLVSGLLFLLAMRRLFPEGAVAGILAFGYLSSHALLLFGTDGEPILLAHLPFLLGGVLLLDTLHRRSWIREAFAGSLLGLSVLFFATSALPVVTIGIALLVAGLLGRRRTGFACALLAALVPLAGLAAAYARSGADVPFAAWITRYGSGSTSLSYGGFSLLSLARVLFGLVDSIVPVGGAARLVRYWTEGEGSIEAAPTDAFSLALWLLALAGTALLLAAGATRIRAEPRRAVFAVLAVSFALLVLFNLQWIGSDPQFWLLPLPILWALFGFSLLGRGRLVGVLRAAVALAVLPLSLFGSVIPLRTDRSAERERATVLARVEPGGLLIAPGLDWTDGVERYDPSPGVEVISLWRWSTRAEWAGDPIRYYAAIDSAISRALLEGRAVYMEGVLNEPFPMGVPWREMRPRGFEIEKILELLQSYRATDVPAENGATLWKIEAPHGADEGALP